MLLISPFSNTLTVSSSRPDLINSLYGRFREGGIRAPAESATTFHGRSVRRLVLQ